MKVIKTNKKYVPMYENGSNFSEIAKYLRAQISSFTPQELPKGMLGGAYAMQAGALGSQLAGIAGQTTKELPFIPNPSDVSAAFQKVPVGTTIDHMDKFLLGQQNSLARNLANSGMASYDVANALAGPMAEAGRTRSQTALDLTYSNADLDRQKAGFNIETDARVNAAENQELSNQNQKLGMFTQKMGEGFGAFGNINSDSFMRRQQIEAMNNAKLSALINQLFTTTALDKIYSS